MAQLTACDNCGKTEPTHTGLVGWWEIVAPGETWLQLNEPHPPFTLCSWGCVAEYAAKREQAAGANSHGVRYRGRAETNDG